ncbi:MAG: hypothetical protein LUQ59_12125 [Methanothrix sp.]|nr:hypothetical protein [Methanothrix sp.]
MKKAKNDTNVVIDTSKYDYKTLRVRDRNGKLRHSVSNGDAVSLAMLNMDHDALVNVMLANKLEDRFSKHAKTLNHGHFRMILGQALRALVRRGKKVKIGKHRIEALDQKIDVSKLLAIVEGKKGKAA